MINIASYIDHTILKPTTTHIEINRICNEALEYGFAAVCVPPPAVRQARALLSAAGSGVKVATVIGFPFGYSTGQAKVIEVKEAIEAGADELDAVINLMAVQNEEWEYLDWEMQTITDQVHSQGKILKVIIESGILTDQQIIACCDLLGRLGVDFVKTSTGYAERGATIEAVKLMRANLPAGIKIKASGGIRQYDFARRLIEAGADRLGCSASIAIVKESELANSEK